MAEEDGRKKASRTDWPWCMARLAGFEPTTPWFVAKYSIQLSYSRLLKTALYTELGPFPGARSFLCPKRGVPHAKAEQVLAHQRALGLPPH